MVWHVPDCFLPSRSSGSAKSHEAFCVLNVSPTDTAELSFTFYFADRAALSSRAELPPSRNVHFRTDQPEMIGVQLPTDVPYACRIASNVPVTVQYSRLDAQEGYALMTTNAIPVG
ncbi:hypothetical protein G1H11_10135 [Phytoactinopolyspora alkaliphila]|uniref:Sensory rhodopsin transducer n=1 Tax=Phytoactinopolyspora alkaliphila TaxID=1783498 RepID=A0A6N9YL69_9ACTN|nr:sensory rhodopsin transducer [Phytoactinopolyspora alkaliphila]NED95670.1 hypothetical protein [Phytoactinopolyspora alkaliphila]